MKTYVEDIGERTDSDDLHNHGSQYKISNLENKRNSSLNVQEKSSIEKGPVQKRKWLVYQSDGSLLHEKEVDWVCFSRRGDEELILNGFIPANFSFQGEQDIKENFRLRIFTRVNFSRNPYIDCMYVVYSTYAGSYILIKDVPTLIDFFYRLEHLTELIFPESYVLRI
ncbi:hypothetical protein DNHGIG_21950 [Collibacillus ludicampi]|uniref:Uncharacterized protein n=1 Tax=Collibacillus ludicampi TaxID=2771369 RepID=A0AAV4LFY9_9BACL|nr:hypothetical protein [Collibacillus ludicampi]GIM46646.1 hypothetical protein DNHGIG_21950 [Collibacillus ludicampi]